MSSKYHKSSTTTTTTTPRSVPVVRVTALSSWSSTALQQRQRLLEHQQLRKGVFRNVIIVISVIVFVQLKSVHFQHQSIALHDKNQNNKNVVASFEKNIFRRGLSTEEQLQDSNHTIKTTSNGSTWNLKPRVLRPYSWELPQSQQDADGNPITKRPLNFVHIPKSGGSSIVQAGIDANLNWGDCLFQQSWPGRTCPSPPKQVWPLEDPEKWGRVWWHIPMQNLPKTYVTTTTTTKNNNNNNITIKLANPYAGFDLFAIIRNPYDRAISEFYYHCESFPNLCKGLEGRRAARVLNRNILKACKIQLQAPHQSSDYFYHWGHWIPQYDFFYHRNGRRMIQHMLHTETLPEEFISLVQSYGYTKLTLPPTPIKARGEQRMDVHNLTLATIKMIEVVYERDFEIGGYSMLSPLLSHTSISSSISTSLLYNPPQVLPD